MDVTAPHPPDAAIVLATVYVPGVLADKFTCPVAILTKTKPAVDENVPATPPPVKVGKGFAALLQYGEAEKLNVATGNAVIVTDVVAVTTPHPPNAAIV
jgi:hypothetical protein